MTQTELDRLICPYCHEHNRPGVKPLIELIGRIVRCGICDTVGHPALFMPWLERLEDSA